jgi:hypothetical protein
VRPFARTCPTCSLHHAIASVLKLLRSPASPGLAAQPDDDALEGDASSVVAKFLACRREGEIRIGRENEEMPTVILLPSPDRFWPNYSDATVTSVDYNTFDEWATLMGAKCRGFFEVTDEESRFGGMVGAAMNVLTACHENTYFPSLMSTVLFYYAGHGVDAEFPPPHLVRGLRRPGEDATESAARGSPWLGGELDLHRWGGAPLREFVRLWESCLEKPLREDRSPDDPADVRSNKHLLFVLDSCYAGKQAADVAKLLADGDVRLPDGCTITVQAACSDSEQTTGQLFTPIFVRLQDVIFRTAMLKAWDDAGRKVDVWGELQVALAALPRPVIESTNPDVVERKRRGDAVVEMPWSSRHSVWLINDPGFFHFVVLREYRKQHATSPPRALSGGEARTFLKGGVFRVLDFKLKKYKDLPFAFLHLDWPNNPKFTIVAHVHFNDNAATMVGRINLVCHVRPPQGALIHVEEKRGIGFEMPCGIYTSDNTVKTPSEAKCESWSWQLPPAWGTYSEPPDGASWCSMLNECAALVKEGHTFVNLAVPGLWEDTAKWNAKYHDSSFKSTFRARSITRSNLRASIFAAKAGGRGPTDVKGTTTQADELYSAMKCGDYNKSKYLIKNGALVDEALQIAIEADDVAVVSFVWDLRERVAIGNAVLSAAQRSDNVFQRVMKTIAANASPEELTNALQSTLRTFDAAKTVLLIDSGAKVSSSDARECLATAAATGKLDMVEALANAHFVNNAVKDTALRAALDNNEAYCAQVLVRAGGHVDAETVTRKLSEVSETQDGAMQLALNLLSLFERACRHATGDGVPKNYFVAANLFEEAAQQGHTIAQFFLGIFYIEGTGVAKNMDTAVEWFRKAAGRGHVPAQFNLGMCYKTATGAAKDDAMAVKWFYRAAKQGDAQAQFCLGMAYNEGIGVDKDETVASEWLRRAAEQGHRGAQHNLGMAAGCAGDAADRLVPSGDEQTWDGFNASSVDHDLELCVSAAQSAGYRTPTALRRRLLELDTVLERVGFLTTQVICTNEPEAFALYAALMGIPPPSIADRAPLTYEGPSRDLSWEVFDHTVDWPSARGHSDAAKAAGFDTPADLFRDIFGDAFDGKGLADKVFSLVERSICTDEPCAFALCATLLKIPRSCPSSKVAFKTNVREFAAMPATPCDAKIPPGASRSLSSEAGHGGTTQIAVPSDGDGKAKKLDKTWAQFDQDCRHNNPKTHGQAATSRMWDVPRKLYEVSILYQRLNNLEEWFGVLMSPFPFPPHHGPICCSHDQVSEGAPFVHALALTDELSRQSPTY